MPAKSESQRRAAGAALGAKRRGDLSDLEGPAHEMAESMTERQLEEFATKPKGAHKGKGGASPRFGGGGKR